MIGFEPATDECQRLNNVKDTFHVPYHCYWVGLGSTNETRRLYHYATNAAANSVYPPNTQHDFEYTEIDIRRFDDFAAEHNIARVDFMKLDIERHELEALKGLGHFLSDERPILGFEIEVHFVPWNDTPLLSEIELYLRPFGYRLMDIDLMRTASPALPTPVAWDHRNEKNEPVKGPTLTGPLTTADALFFLDPNTLHTKHGVTSDPYSMIKLISLYEMYGLSDVAADLLIRYQHLVLPLMQPTYTLDDCLNNMVPACFGAGLSYQQYMAIYEDCQGRPHFLTPDILRKHGRAPASGGIAAKRRRWAKWPFAAQMKS